MTTHDSAQREKTDRFINFDSQRLGRECKDCFLIIMIIKKSALDE